MKHYAILTGGPSLRDFWNPSPIYEEVWAINHIGKEFAHDYACHLDRAAIFGNNPPPWKGWTRKGVHHPHPDEVNAFDPLSQISFPFFLAKMFRETPPDSRIHIFGWDCCGVGIDGEEWNNVRNAQERALVARYWQREKAGQIFGEMRDWAERTLGTWCKPVMDREMI